MRYEARCTCGSSISGFDRAATLKWKREEARLHATPKWLTYFKNQKHTQTVEAR